MYKAFYKPANGEYVEVFETSETLEGLSPDALLIIQMNEDGTRQAVYEKLDLTPKEQTFFEYAQRQLEFKHDGGPSATPPHTGDFI